MPYIPRDAVKQALLDGPKLSRDVRVASCVEPRCEAGDRARVCVCEGAEPMPYIPRDAVKQALLDGPKLSRDVLVNSETTRSSTPASLELMTLPVCLQFARTLAGRSLVGRRLIAAEARRTAAAPGSSRRARSLSEAGAAAAAAAAAAAGDGGDEDEPSSGRLKAVVHTKRLHSAFV